MQMRELPRGRQYSDKGNIVNVPVEIPPVVDALSHPFDENVTVPVKLKKNGNTNRVHSQKTSDLYEF